MKRKSLFGMIAVVTTLALLAGMVGLTVHFANLPERISQHETILLGQNRFIPGSQAALRVLVRDSKDAAPLPGAEIAVRLQAEDGELFDLFSGKTDDAGTVDVAFRVPDKVQGKPNLIVETRSRLGSDRIQRPVSVERDYRVLLTSDKPIYQPGQTIHLRALALSTFDLHPAAGESLEFIIADGEGNKVFRQTAATSEYGVAAVDFQLADEVNTGAYKITTVMGQLSSEKTVTVERYVLPKFSAKLNTDRSFYLPGERVTGSLAVEYFYGKAVAGGQVSLEGYTYDFERQTVVTIEGTTGEDGRFDFEFDLPEYLAGSDLETGGARFYLQATVTDLADHSETANLSLPVAQDRLLIEAVPESGVFKTGVENIVYLLTSYPDGTPAPAELSLSFDDTGRTISAESDAYGLAEVKYTPMNAYLTLSVDARGREGEAASRQFSFEGAWTSESLILRPDRPLYRVGDSMKLTVLASQPQARVYLDIVREGQTLSTRSLAIESGRGETVVDLSPDLFGTLELHAYIVLSDGTIIRDTRLVVVDPAADLSLALIPDRETYLPGDAAGLDVQVSGSDGEGVQAALGLAVVDESVFALAEQDPGFAKLYFMLEKELLEPKFDLHGFSLPEVIGGGTPDDPAQVQAQGSAAQAALAGTGASAAWFGLQANSHQDAMNHAYQLQSDFFTAWSKILFGLALLIPLAAVVVSGIALHRDRHLSRSLIAALAAGWLITLAVLLWPLGDAAQWISTPLDRVGWLLEHIVDDDGLFPVIVGLGLIGLVGLSVMAIRRKDGWLGLSLGLIVVYLVTLGALMFSVTAGNVDPSEGVLLVGMLAYLVLGLACMLRAAGFAFQKRPAAALAGVCLAIFMIVAVLPGLAYAAGGARMGSALTGQGIAEDVVFANGVEAMPQEQGKGMPMPMATPAGMLGEVEAPAAGSEPQTAQPPRLRQYFPETMVWLPEVVTDGNGQLHVEFPVADSITTWRMTALASSRDGRLGSLDAGLRVFQDFFVDIDLPVSLTVGDEISIPVGVFNYLAEAQTVKLELEPDGWFEQLDAPVQEISIAANDISVVYFRLRATQFGQQALQVTATGTSMSDAIRREVRVYPDGQPVRFTQSDRLAEDAPADQMITIPAAAIPGTQKLSVKIYPGVLSQVVEGLDSMLAMPSGCFEQTSSTTYPNVLVLDYLRSTNQVSPETEMRAEEYINLGYQRLLTFEVDGGGFSLFGDAPADRMLTAYGLQEFSDMARVHAVDEALIDRTAEWLLASQQADGTWENDTGLVHESTWQSLGNDRLPVTAYIVWSLIEAGYGDDPRTQTGLDYLREFQAQAEDPYALALVANALVAADRQAGEISGPTEAALERLAAAAIREGSGATWQSQVATFVGGEGQTGSIETTALAAYAFLRADRFAELANAALTALIQQKDSVGTWYSTQATVLTLKALIQSISAGAETTSASVTIRLNDGETRSVLVTPETFDVVQLVSFADVTPGADNRVSITTEGRGNLMYQITGEYYLPWDQAPGAPQAGVNAVDITVDYDRTALQVDDLVTVNVRVALREGAAEQGLIDLGLPPGFTAQVEDLQGLVTRFDDVPAGFSGVTIERFELTGRQILVYVRNLSVDKPLEFSYRLKAEFPLKVQAPASQAYDYYNPEVTGSAQPQELVVEP